MPRPPKDHGNTSNGATKPPYEGAYGRPIGTREIRCLHTEHGRPVREEDKDQEFHWRCPAWFDCPSDTLPYCPQHLSRYRASESGEQVTPDEMAWAEETIDRYVETVTPGRARKARQPEAEEALTDEDLERLRVYREDQLRRAIEAGIISQKLDKA